MTNCIDLFEQVSIEVPVPEIARRLGLHPNTIARWIDNQNVPAHYTNDFARMLGQEGQAEDQFFTKPAVAIQCLNTAMQVMKSLGIDTSIYHFIEPSAGCGYFYDILPPNKRTGIDIEPLGCGLEQADFLLWEPPTYENNVVIGNPPFGLRGHLALQFINHAAQFADVVAFILPQLFDSDGKGVPAKRVDSRLRLAYSQPLSSDAFILPDGTDIEISTIFQVWTAINHDRIKIKSRKTATQYIKIYSLSDGGTPASTRNKDMIGKCDLYLPSTCFKGMQAYSAFDDLPNKRGYGIVIHKAKRDIKSVIKKHDWLQTAFPSTNGAINLRASLIEDVITKAGHYDK